MILICYGTRPEWLKVKPIIEEIKKRKMPFKTLFTGQHKNLIDVIGDYQLKIEDLTENRLDNIISSILVDSQNIFENITHILIQGDTTSVLALGIKAFHHNVKIIHLEAGLRTYDLNNPWPEEMNRQLISRISDINFCPTKLNQKNLIKEKIFGKIYVVGNTILDNIKDIPTSYENKILITLHRRENHNIIDKWFIEIDKIAKFNKDIEFVLPIHPNPNVKKNQHFLKHVKVVDPMNHNELIEFLSKSLMVITDSGGIQEEASFLNKKIIICRKTTERPESLGIHSFLCKTPKNIYKIFNKIKNNFIVNEPCPFGDGYSSIKIVDILENLC
jgi:UDP-N-acetylglucosamine 2-epimerase